MGYNIYMRLRKDLYKQKEIVMYDREIEEQEYNWNLWREEQRLSGFSNREIRKAMREEIREKRKIRNK